MRTRVPGLLAIALGALAGCGKQSEPIVFGHIDPKAPGDFEYRALKLAVELTNDDPAKRPFDRRVHILHAPVTDERVTVETAEAAQATAVRLASVNKTFALIGGRTATVAERIGQAAQSEPELAFTMSGWNGTPTNRYLFPVGIAPSEAGKYLARYARESLKPKRVAILVEETSLFHKAVADAFHAEVQGIDTVRFAAPVRGRAGEGDDKQKRDEESRVEGGLRAPAPDVILLAMNARDALDWSARLAGKATAEKPSARAILFGGEEGELSRLFDEPERTENWYAVSGFAADESTDRCQAFIEAYRKAYGEAPNGSAALTYDAYMVLLQACKRAPEASASKVREELRKKEATFEVLTGNLTFALDQTARRPVFIVQLAKNGTVKRLQRFEPSTESVPAKQ